MFYFYFSSIVFSSWLDFSVVGEISLICNQQSKHKVFSLIFFVFILFLKIFKSMFCNVRFYFNLYLGMFIFLRILCKYILRVFFFYCSVRFGVLIFIYKDSFVFRSFVRSTLLEFLDEVMREKPRKRETKRRNIERLLSGYF